MPALFVCILCIGQTPIPSPVSNALKFFRTPFDSFITLAEAESINAEGSSVDAYSKKKINAPAWFTILLSSMALLETVFWMGLTSFLLAAANDDENYGQYPLWVALKVLSWIYASIKPIIQPTATTPYDLFVIYIVQFVVAVVDIGEIIFDHYVYDILLPSGLVITLHIVNISISVLSLVLVLSQPLAIPADYIPRNEIVSLEIMKLLSKINFDFFLFFRESL